MPKFSNELSKTKVALLYDAELLSPEVFAGFVIVIVLVELPLSVTFAFPLRFTVFVKLLSLLEVYSRLEISPAEP